MADGKNMAAGRRAALADEIAAIVLADGLDALALRGLAARLGTSGRMLLYYFGTKDALVEAALLCVSARMEVVLTEVSAGDRVTPGAFLRSVLGLSEDARIAPFMLVWTDVIARAARGEAPYRRIAGAIVAGWMAGIEDRLEAGDGTAGRAAAILSMVEGAMLLEQARPGTAAEALGYLARVLEG